jgi:small-conductance mechanosensitive channel
MSRRANRFPVFSLLVLTLLGAGLVPGGVAAGAPSDPAQQVAPDSAQSPAAIAASDSLLKVLAGLVLAEIRTLPRDTLVVRIDTSRSAAADTASVVGVQRIQQELGNVGRRIVIAILIIVLVYYLLRGLLWLIETIADRSATRRLFFKRLIPIVRMLTWAMVLYFIVANVFDVDRNGLLAASAALGIGIGLAAQDVIKNILSGIIIIFDAPFQVGDKVRVGETYGEVKSIGLRSTRIVTLNDSLVSVPNSQLVDDQVSNANAGVLDCQVVTTLFLPGWTDVALAKKIAYEAAANSRFIYLDKPIVVNVRDDFRETFLTEIIVKAYVLDHLYEAALASDITETAKMGFLEAGLLYPVYGLEPPEDLIEHQRGGGRP